MTKAEVNRETTIADACNAIARLEKENAELEKRCANYEMKISKMEKGTCDVCKETEKDKKIVELETRCNELFLQTCEQAEKIEELKKWKDEWQEQVQKATDEGYARTLQTIQLTKAKEIIKKFSEFVNNEVEYDPEHPQEHTDLWNDLCEEAEQFIKDSEGK